MKIRYLGHSCFQWITDSGVKIVSDPYTKVGYELSKGLHADIVTVSHEHFDHNFLNGIQSIGSVVRGALTYEEKDVKIVGIATKHDPCGGRLRGENTVYKIYADGLVLCHLGDLGEVCTDELIEKIGAVDVLFIPIGGTYTIDCVQAKEYVDKIQPKAVIPMHYKPIDGSLDIATEVGFLQLFDEKSVSRKVGELCIEAKEVSSMNGKIIFMERTDKV